MCDNSLILTREKFNVQIRKLFSCVSVVEVNWSLRSLKDVFPLSNSCPEDVIFLIKRLQVPFNCTRCSTLNIASNLSIYCDSLLAEDIHSNVDPLYNINLSHYHSLEIHLVYNEAFAVPELFFTLHHKDCSQFSPEEVELFVRNQSPHIFPQDCMFSYLSIS